MKYLWGLFFCFAIYLPSYCQQATGNGAVSGIVSDAASKQPVQYATVSIYPDGSSKPANGMITDEKGNFFLGGLLPGRYTVKIEFIGYKTIVLSNIEVNAAQKTKDIGKIYLSDNSNSLNGVTVTGTRNTVEYHIDKLVYNADKDLTSQTGTATDVLQKVPQVSVDVDGNVELLGNANVRVFINGKPSVMFDNNLADALQTIPANQIKRIEVITSPGAKYDAEGTAGIINIVLKESNAAGVNGNINITAGTRLENGTASLNVKKGKVMVSASLSGNALLLSATPNSLDRTSYDSLQNRNRLMQQGNGNLHREGYKAQTGLEWTMSKKDDLTASLGYNTYTNYLDGTTYQAQATYAAGSDTLLSGENNVRNFTNQYTSGALDWDVDYKRKFAREGQELNLMVQQTYFTNNAGYTQQQAYAEGSAPFTGATSSNRMHDHETYIIADYAMPVNKVISIETGMKGTFSNIRSYSDYYGYSPGLDAYIPDPTLGDNFNYQRQVYAAYASLTWQLSDKYSMKIGVRDEQTQQNADTKGSDAHVKPAYNFLVPAIAIMRKLGDDQSLKFSFTRRIERPDYKDLNPYIDATDPNNLAEGNPNLLPERGYSTELSYNKSFSRGGSVLATLYNRYNIDDNQRYVSYYSALTVGDSVYQNVSVYTNVNVGSQTLTGINLYGSVPISGFQIRGNVLFFNKYITGDIGNGPISVSSFNFRSNVNASYQASKTLAFEAFGNFNSPRTEIQGHFPAFSTYSFAIRKYLFNKKASIAFATTDPFNEYVDQRINVTGSNFTYVSDRKVPYRSFGLSFNYKFGSMDYKPKKDESDDNSDEGG